MRTLGVLLAGGRGARLQAPGPKALAMCAGRTLLARAMETLDALCDTVVVVAPAAMALPVPADRRVSDPPGMKGPLGALVAGLGSRPFDEALVLAVDLPLLTSDALAALRAHRGGEAAVVPAPGGIPQPLAAWYAAHAAAALAGSLAAGERAVTRAVMHLAPVLLGDTELAGMPRGVEAWLNVNTRADLLEAERRLSAGRRP